MKASVRACLFSLAMVVVTTATAGGDPVVLSAGKTRVHQSELSARLSRLHEFEKQSFGSNDAQVKRGFLEKKIVPEVLAAEEARARGYDKESSVVSRVNDLLVQTLKDSIQREVDSALTDQEIEKYCESHRGEKSNTSPGTRGAAPNCKRDHLSYRIALRREKAHAKLSELRARLKKDHVRRVDYELLTQLPAATTTAPKGSR